MQLAWMPAHAIADAIRGGEISAGEVTTDFLGRVEKLEPHLHSFITVAAESALASAAAMNVDSRLIIIGSSTR